MGITYIVVQPYHHYPSSELSSSQTEIPYPLNTNSPFCHVPLPSPLATMHLFSISVSLTVLGTSSKWNNSIFVFCDYFT